MAGLLTSFRAAMGAFRKSYFHASDGNDTSRLSETGDWSSYEARMMRYAILWASYQNDQYFDDVHRWATKYKADHGLYRNTRALFGPTYRITELYVTHIMGGRLDVLNAGDGEDGGLSAIPISDATDEVRNSIAKLWQLSAWEKNKDLWVRRGACLGDTFLEVIDDPITRTVRIAPVHPNAIREIQLDQFGRISGYIREEKRPDPDRRLVAASVGSEFVKDVTYTELCQRSGNEVQFSTYKDGQPYGWYGAPAEWSMPYPGVPLFHVEHICSGLGWGFSEVNAALAKTRETDDIGSKTNDQIRKTVEAIWFLSGVTRGENAVDLRDDRKRSATDPGSNADRERSVFLYAKDPSARAQAMVADLPIQDVTDHLRLMLEQMEADYPEIRYDNLQLSGSASGNTLREARKPADKKIRIRRQAYDHTLSQAMALSIAIGSENGYEGFSGISYSDILSGDQQFSIGDRPVYEWGEYEELEEESLFWATAKVAVDCGIPIEMFLERHGWDPQAVARVKQNSDNRELARQRASARNPFTGVGNQ